MKTIKQIESEANHLYRLCLIDGSLDENRVRLVVRRVVESKRRGAFVLLSHFLRYVKRDCARRTAKVESAKRALSEINPEVRVVPHGERLTAANAERIIADYDIVADGSDNFATRYLLNDACYRLQQTLVAAAPVMAQQPIQP